jgi:hypothetical protein
MIKSLETAVSAFTQLAVVCSFGLSVAIGIAGVAKSKLPFECAGCAAITVAATTTSPTG